MTNPLKFKYLKRGAWAVGAWVALGCGHKPADSAAPQPTAPLPTAALAGQRVEVETPHPRAATKGLAERLDGRLLESVEAVGKNVLLRFEDGLVLRSHLRMSGRWRVELIARPIASLLFV